MKKSRLIVPMALLCLTLTACAGPAAEDTPGVTEPIPAPPASTAPAPTPEPVPTPTPEPPQLSVCTDENGPAREAYAAALKTLLDQNILPDGRDVSYGYIGSIEQRETMAENQFTVYDVDGDGREELVLLYTTTITAGHRGFVFDWDEATGELRKQLEEYPLFTFYQNGAVKAGWSHNQGKGGSFWPYFLYQYLPETDSYQQVGAVDAWDQALGIEGYPQEVDESGTGFVYYITTEGNIDRDRPVDAAQYQAWLSPYLGEASQVPLPYLPLTAEHIQMMKTPG